MTDRAKVVTRLIRNKMKLNTGAEIGTWRGHTAEHLLRAYSQLKLICVDPYESYEEYKAEACTCMLQAEYDQLYISLSTSFNNRFPDRIEWIRKRSVEAVLSVKDCSLDFVFIDGNHEYEFVKEDLSLWLPKVRLSGVVCGHDIDKQGVRQALKDLDVPYRFSGKRCWYFIKRK